MKNNELTDYEEFKEDIESDIAISERKKFKKQFKQIKRQLRKDVKNFQPWDYCYLLNLIEHSLQAMSLYLCNKYLVAQDTEDEYNHWKEYSYKLKECYELVKYGLDDHAALKKAFKIMSEYITTWWD